MSSLLYSFALQFGQQDAPVAPDLSFTMSENGTFTITPGITVDGSPVTATAVAAQTAPANGSVSGGVTSLIYTPSVGFYGPDTFTYTATADGVESNVATVTITVLAEECTEFGRATKAYVTGYNLSRVHASRVIRFQRRCITANFNGAMPSNRSIVKVRWDCTSPWATLMANPRIIFGQREVAVDATFNFAGWGAIKATVHLDNGEVMLQEFHFRVQDTPLYPGATYDTANGPFTLEYAI